MLIVAAASAITANFFFIVIIPLFLFLKIYVFLDVYNLAKINRKINCAFMVFGTFVSSDNINSFISMVKSIQICIIIDYT